MPIVSGSTVLITPEENSCEATKISAQIGQTHTKKLIMIHSSLSPIDERPAQDCNFIHHYVRIGAEIVCITFAAETAGSICAAKRVNSEEGRARGCGLGDCSRAN